MSTHPGIGSLFEGALVERHGRPTGCRLLDRKGLVDGRDSVDAVEWTLSHEPTGPRATRSTVLCGRADVEHASMDDFAEHVARLRGLIDGTNHVGLATLAASCRRHMGRGCDTDPWALVRDKALADLRDALAVVALSLDLLDPLAMGASVRDLRKFGNGIYALLDTHTDPDAPLGIAHAMRPHFADAMQGILHFHGPAVRAATKARDGAALDAILRRSMTFGNGWSPKAAALGFRVSEAMDAMSSGEREAFRASCRHGPGGSHVSRIDPPHALGPLLVDVPADWLPRDTAGWLALARCTPALADAHRRCAPGTARLRLNAGGDWAALGERLGSAAGLPAEAAPGALARAIDDIHDMAVSFEAQVLRPARDLSGIHGAGDGDYVATALLHDGRTLRRSLEMSTRWHKAQAGISAGIAALPGAAPRSWPAALPDWTRGEVRLTVLTDAAQLRAEGAGVPDAEGVTGLTHCVGGYAGSCLSGHSRIVSLRRSTPDGEVRLSTAQLRHTRDGLALLQHRGPGNADPCKEAHEALAAYAGAIHDGRLRVDERGLVPIIGQGMMSVAAGYDVGGAGNWERVVALWGPHMPRHLRGIDRMVLARLFGRPHDASLSDMPDIMVDLGGRGEHWLPTPFRPTGTVVEGPSP